MKTTYISMAAAAGLTFQTARRVLLYSILSDFIICIVPFLFQAYFPNTLLVKTVKCSLVRRCVRAMLSNYVLMYTYRLLIGTYQISRKTVQACLCASAAELSQADGPVRSYIQKRSVFGIV